jgi:hypothetical protein
MEKGKRKDKTKSTFKSNGGSPKIDKKNKGGQPGNDNALKWTEEKALKIAAGLIEWLKIDDNVFFQDYLVMEHGLYKEIVSYLCTQYGSFLNDIKRAKEIQEIKLQKAGFKGESNPAVTIFLLKYHHKYTDKTQVEVKETHPPLYRGKAVKPKYEVAND